MKKTGGVEVTLNSMKPGSTKEKPSTLEENMIEPEPVSSNGENGVAKSSSNLPIVDLKEYDIAEKTIHFIHIDHVIDKTKIKSTEAEEKLKKAEFNFMIDLKILV